MELVKPSREVHPNILLYGPPKSGKSVGASTAPGANLIVNADLPNATRFAHARDKEGRLLEPKMPDYAVGSTALFDLMAEIAVEVMRPDGERTIDSVVADPIGEMYRRLLEEQSGRAIRPRIDTFGDVGTHIERWCRRLCEAPVTVVFVCHELEVPNGDEVSYIPFTGTRKGSPVLGQKLMGMVDVVGYTAAYQAADGETKFGVQLVSAKGRLGGDRFGCLGAFREEINIAEWADEIKAFEGGARERGEPLSDEQLAQEIDRAEEPGTREQDPPQEVGPTTPPRRGRKASTAAAS